jgi:hypothetical protein
MGCYKNRPIWSFQIIPDVFVRELTIILTLDKKGDKFFGHVAKIRNPMALLSHTGQIIYSIQFTSI